MTSRIKSATKKSNKILKPRTPRKELSKEQKQTKKVLGDRVYSARRKTLIFFDLIAFGWGTRDKTKSYITFINSPLSKDPLLGFPTFPVMMHSYLDVMTAAKEEVFYYRRCNYRWQECRRRYLATTNRATWEKYINGRFSPKGLNRFKTKIDKYTGLPYEVYDFKYRYKDLLPRIKERKRAARELRAEIKEMMRLREIIFDKMGVPKQYRKKVIGL